MTQSQPIPAAELGDACGADPGFFCEFVFDATGNERLAEVGELLIRPAKVILILAAAWVVTRILHRVVDRAVNRLIVSQQERFEDDQEVTNGAASSPGRLATLRALAERRAAHSTIHLKRGQQRAETLGAVLRSAVSLVVFTVASLVALGEFNINLGPLIASAGVVGVAIGFGAQSLVRDFLSGIFMIVEDQFGVGDVVDVGEAAGVVEEVKLRTTKIRDINGALWHVPNGEIHRVANKSQEWARAVLDVEVAYDTDISHAMTVIKRVADSVWQDALDHATVLEEPEIWGVQDFGASSIAIRLVLKVEPAEQWAVEREVRLRLKVAFDAEGIEIPFPQQTVWVRGLPTAAGGPDAPGDQLDT